MSGSIPKTCIVPEVLGETQAIIFIVEVFPAPFGPRKPNNSPFFTVKLILSTAIISPNFFSRSCTSIIPGMVHLFINKWFGYTAIKNPHTVV
jgi:hypothetical protein